MAELSRIVYTALLVVGFGIAIGLFFSDFSVHNLAPGTSNYTFIDNSTTNANLIAGPGGSIAQMSAAAGNLTVIGSDPVTSTLTILKGGLAFFVLPVQVGQYLGGLIAGSLTIIGIPASLTNLVIGAFLFMGFIGLVAAAANRTNL